MSFAVYLAKKYYLNQATQYYIDILIESINGDFIGIYYNLSEIKKADKIIVIDAKSFILVKLRYPNKKIYTWYQGVVANEALMMFNSYFRYSYWSIFEFLSVHFSDYNFFVSSRMLKHFSKKYRYHKNNNTIMPCFNKQFNMRLENVNKYNKLSFVYAGSLDTWQCIDKTLLLFKEIYNLDNSATMILLTSDKVKASDLVNKYKLKNITIDFVSLDIVDEVISKYHYGFILRDDHIVNNVATPTKMSSYLSVGTIPIYSNVIDDFKININDQCSIVVENDMSLKEIAKMIIEDNNNGKSFNIIKKDIKDIFYSYYDRDMYISKIRNSKL